MKDQQNIWVGVDQLKNDEAYQKQVQEEFFELPLAEQAASSDRVEGSRRDFLKYLGFGIGAACGILVPELHKVGNESIEVYPTVNYDVLGTGLNSKGIGVNYSF